MAKRSAAPNRVHLIAHANPLGPDAARFGFIDADEYIAFARSHLPRSLELTCDAALMRAEEQPWQAGRSDDAQRIRDLQKALGDRRTLAIVAAGGGAYFSRILPHLDFSPLNKRSEPLWALGFSEMTTLVNHVASHRYGRGLYWLSPNWIAYRILPAEAARAALAEYWRSLPELLAGRVPGGAHHLDYGPVEGEVVSGKVASGSIRLVGGCLAVLAAVMGGPLGRRGRPEGKWLILEDIKESPYRIDRHLAALKLAGWFERAAGVLIGDFHMMNNDTQPAVLELLKYHLPARGRPPVVATRSFGHTWPVVPILLNRPARLEASRGRVTIHAFGGRSGGGGS